FFKCEFFKIALGLVLRRCQLFVPDEEQQKTGKSAHSASDLWDLRVYIRDVIGCSYRTMKRRLGLAAAWSICAIIVDCSVATSQPASAEYQVKAAFLYNFAKFVEWPPQAFRSPDSPFTICLAGDPFEGALDRTVQGELLDRRPLMVRRIIPAEDLRGCQMIYVAPNERRSEEIINAAALLLASTALIGYDYIAARRDLRTSTTTLARIIADELTAAVSFNDHTTAVDTLNALRAEPSVVGACVYSGTNLFAEQLR